MTVKSIDAVAEFSREQLANGSKSFALAARLFHPDIRDSAQLLYAWCRYCDDVIDGQELGQAVSARELQLGLAPEPGLAPAERLDDLRAKTRAACRGYADEPPFVALSRVVERHRIPERHALELLDGFAMDTSGQSYASIEDTMLYCYHVAGVVGLMMVQIMGARDRPTLLRACDLGLAFQLTNISRDVVEDWQNNRVYLPADWLAAEGVTTADAGLAQHRAAVARVTARLLAEADRYYDSAWHGIGALPFRSACSIAAARAVYRAIGRKVRVRGAQAWDQRVVVSRRRKVASLVSAVAIASAARMVNRGSTPPRHGGLWTHPSLV